MAYQLKYFLEYKSLKVGSSDTYRLELWQNTAVELTAEEIKGGRSPFSLEMPQLGHKFQVIRGRGCTINLLSDTDMKFFEGLKHIDPQEFKYIHKLNGSVIGLGYLNSDMYSESYDQTTNYIISTTGNDGFSLMDRFRFLQSDETRYIGLKSKWELIQICLNKVGLSYNDIRINISTTIPAYIITPIDPEHTLLHDSVVNCDNFYDEDGLAMTMRQVLDSILAPYGAFIVQDNGSIYITDIHTLAGGGSISFKKYNASTYAYIELVSVTIQKDIYDVGYFGTGHSIERSGGTNMQRVVYSPYPVKIFVEQSIYSPNEFSTVPETYSVKNDFNYKTLVGHPIWQNIPMSLSTFEESYYEDSDRYVYYRYPMNTSNIAVFELVNPNGIFLAAYGTSAAFFNYIADMQSKRYLDGIGILITGEVLTKTFNNPYLEVGIEGDTNINADNVKELQINYEISIGDLYYNQDLDKWEETFNSDGYIKVTDNDTSISNKWKNIGEDGQGHFIKLRGDQLADLSDSGRLYQGFFNFKIWSNTKTRLGGRELILNDTGPRAVLKEVWIKNLQFKFVNIDGSDIEDSDVEYIGNLNKLFAQEGEEIVLTTGTQSRFSDLGQIMKYIDGVYSSIPLWTRAGQTFKIEELLLNSLCSNYRTNFVTLNGLKLKNEFSLLNVFTDTTFLEDNPIMMIKSSIIDYENYTHEVTLVEISEDELTIVKE